MLQKGAADDAERALLLRTAYTEQGNDERGSAHCSGLGVHAKKGTFHHLQDVGAVLDAIFRRLNGPHGVLFGLFRRGRDGFFSGGFPGQHCQMWRLRSCPAGGGSAQRTKSFARLLGQVLGVKRVHLFELPLACPNGSAKRRATAIPDFTAHGRPRRLWRRRGGCSRRARPCSLS